MALHSRHTLNAVPEMTRYLVLTAFDMSSAVLCYQSNPSFGQSPGKCRVVAPSCEVPLAASTQVQVNGGITWNIAVARLDSSSVLVCYADTSETEYGKCRAIGTPEVPGHYDLQLSQACSPCAPSLIAGAWCASLEEDAYMYLTACDDQDERQRFSYDEQAMLLRVEANVSKCVSLEANATTGREERNDWRLQMAPCDAGSALQKFILDAVNHTQPSIVRWLSLVSDASGTSLSIGQSSTTQQRPGPITSASHGHACIARWQMRSRQFRQS